jgi:hypothetical protein
MMRPQSDEDAMNDVFVSYSRLDSALAQRRRDNLVAPGRDLQVFPTIGAVQRHRRRGETAVAWCVNRAVTVLTEISSA